MAEYKSPTDRDLTKKPYSPDEQRVMDFLQVRITQEAAHLSPEWVHAAEQLPQDAINDPIGYLLAEFKFVDAALSLLSNPPSDADCPVTQPTAAAPGDNS